MTFNPDVPGVWRDLFVHALRLMDNVAEHGRADPFWTFGGGTVLMLRHQHRFSKDIDIFVPDPQALGYVTPRLSAVAESITTDYDEANNYVKLVLPAGEIDVVAAPNLTAPGYEQVAIMGHPVKVETSAEIVAKKMWHRGNRATARDLFDLALVIEREPDALTAAAKYLIRHRAVFIEQLHSRSNILRMQFNAIDTLQYSPSFEHCVKLVSGFLEELPG